MNFKEAYNYLIANGFSQKLILTRIHQAGILPLRGRQFSKGILSQMAKGEYAKHQEAESFIIELCKKEKEKAAPQKGNGVKELASV